ncbi:MAG: hypothetical protein A2096_06160 [Spirochaetes bacterium GWF1_41_5]|nr:MAG: hypothetical protein A2096_06160 [Spirochaetes bacterium GWF1_41_5]
MHQDKTEAELEDLKEQLENFKKEKERIRNIIGRIGGIPSLNTRLFNVIFFIILISCFAVSMFASGKLELLMIDLAIAMVSLKIMYIIHQNAKVNHFQLWILSSIEWRLNEALTEMQKITRKTDMQE